jgi:filamentous hemagglutinin family protein
MNFHFPLKVLSILSLLFFGLKVHALPVGGYLTSGTAVINGNSASMTITQSSPNAVINWQSFNIGQNEAVKFVQPNSSSVALNRVVGSDASSILGNLSSNGKVFLVNPNGILFGKGAQVNVGGLVASTLDITDGDFMAGIYKFSGNSIGKILNQGTITTNVDGSYVALLGANVVNNGAIIAKLGTVALAAGADITLDLVGDSLLNLVVNQGTINALVQNGGLIQADGGLVLLTTQGVGSLLQSVVNNTGVIQAQTIDNRTGNIKLLADMQSGTVNVGGTLLAQGGVNGGDGGFIETSASRVVITDSAMINTLAPQGKTGLWLLDPVNWTIGAALGAGVDETAAHVVTSLATSDRLIIATNDINVNAPIALASVQILTLNAGHDVNINNSITGGTAANGVVLIAGNNVNVAAQLDVGAAASSIKISAGNDVNIAAPVGPVLAAAAYQISITAGRDVNASAAIGSTAAGAASNISLNAGRNLNINARISIVGAASTISLLAGLNGTGPGVAGGTVILGSLASTSSINTIIRFNPVSYATTSAEIAAYSTKVTGVLDAKAWVFTQGNSKVYDGTTAATLSIAGNPSPSGNLMLTHGIAAFNTIDTGTGKTINFSGFSMSGIDTNKFALFSTSGTTTGNITPAPLTITVANATKPYGETVTLTGFSVNGLLNGETIAEVMETSPGTVANATVAGSPYLITAGLANGGTFNPSNYSIVYVNGLLVVTPVIAMSVSSVPAPAIAAMATEVQPEQQDELISIVPADVAPAAPTQTAPNI